GYGKANALVTTAAAQNRRIDADETTLRIHKRATRVTRIDCSVCLDEVFVIKTHSAATASSADDTARYCLANPQSISDSKHDIPDFNRVTVGHGDGRQVLGIDLDYSNVALGITANDFSGEFASVLQSDFYFLSTVHDVVIGQDVAIFGNDNS